MSSNERDRHLDNEGDDAAYEDPAYDEADYDDGEYDYDDYDEVEGAAVQQARQRKRKALITVGVLLGILAIGLGWAFIYSRGSTGSATPAPTCVPADQAAVSPAKVTLNVYNATSRAGLAASTAKEFTAQGYKVAKVANDPLKKTITGPAEIRFGPQGKVYAALVATSVGTGAIQAPDDRKDATVDVALGQGFVNLTPLPSASAGLPACPAPVAGSPTPSPSKS